jgi:hypothetical protein
MLYRMTCFAADYVVSYTDQNECGVWNAPHSAVCSFKSYMRAQKRCPFPSSQYSAFILATGIVNITLPTYLRPVSGFLSIYVLFIVTAYQPDLSTDK